MTLSLESTYQITAIHNYYGNSNRKKHSFHLHSNPIRHSLHRMTLAAATAETATTMTMPNQRYQRTEGKIINSDGQFARKENN